MTENDLGRLLSARDAEIVLGIPAATVRSWFRRKERTGLWDFARDQRNHPLFYEQHLVDLRDRAVHRDTHRRKR